MSDGQWLLPASQIREYWEQQRKLARELEGDEDISSKWKADIEDGIIAVHGNVKPLLGSDHWIPISQMNGDIHRYLDFDPPEGGNAGQVIEVDPEGCTHRVLAVSLADFLEAYADDLEAGHYAVVDDVIERIKGPPAADTMSWGVPEYLRDITYDMYSDEEAANAEEASRPPAALRAGEETVLAGRMNTLASGSSGLIFVLTTSSGSRYWIRADPERTRGYGAIAVLQGARVRIRRVASGPRGQRLQILGLTRPRLLAVEYEMLRYDD